MYTINIGLILNGLLGLHTCNYNVCVCVCAYMCVCVCTCMSACVCMYIIYMHAYILASTYILLAHNNIIAI